MQVRVKRFESDRASDIELEINGFLFKRKEIRFIRAEHYVDRDLCHTAWIYYELPKESYKADLDG